MINHFTVAQVRYAFGTDTNTEELDQATADCFDGLVANFEVADGS